MQELRQTEEIDLYYFNPLSGEDEEDDGNFFGKISREEDVEILKNLFEKVLQPGFSLNVSPQRGGGYYQLTVKTNFEKVQEDQLEQPANERDYE